MIPIAYLKEPFDIPVKISCEMVLFIGKDSLCRIYIKMVMVKILNHLSDFKLKNVYKFDTREQH